MLKSCPYCGRLHQYGEDCPKKPKRKYRKRRKPEENSFEADYIRFTSSGAWQRTREQVKQRDLYLCRVCQAEGRADGGRAYDPQVLEVHHITPVKEEWGSRFDTDNLITLCREHHEAAEAGRISRERLKDCLKTYPPGGKV